ncbi:MAG: multiheme c-type cytochrome [Sedimenticola sp.]
MQCIVSYQASTMVWLLGILTLVAHPALAEAPVAPGPFTDSECVNCHTQRDPELIRQWRDGPHAPASAVGCSSCHGDHHSESNEKARKEQRCTGCHQGPASHSYTTSKHGVINRLGEEKEDWSKPLKRGNYRAPTCSYCHLHNRDHGDTMATHPTPEVRQWICMGCHSPRYVRELFASGERQLAIADLKLTEGEQLIASAADSQTEALSKLRQHLNIHRKNVLYGVGHQSPDYQWWHGQPALDGDLIRIRDVISQSRQR